VLEVPEEPVAELVVTVVPGLEDAAVAAELAVVVTLLGVVLLEGLRAPTIIRIASIQLDGDIVLQTDVLRANAVWRSAAVQFVSIHAPMAAVPVTQKQLRSVRPEGQAARAQLRIHASGVCALTIVAATAIAINEKYFIF